MERYEKRHSKHHKEKHKKHGHRKHRTHSSGTHQQSYSTISSTKPLVEYSDVSSEDLSAPEAGEIESEASPIGRHIADDLDRTRKSHSIRTFVDGKIISVTTSSRRRSIEEYGLTHDSSSAASRKKREMELEYSLLDIDHARYKKKKEKRKKDKKKKKKRRHSRSASLESLSPDELVPSTPAKPVTPQRYETVPISEWEKPSSPLRNGSCSSPSTPPLMRDRREAPLRVHNMSFSPLTERTPQHT